MGHLLFLSSYLIPFGPILWAVLWGFFFVVQLLLCIVIRRKRWPKLIPTFFLLTEWVDIAIYYFAYEMPHNAGIGSLGLDMVVGMSSLGFLCAWGASSGIIFVREITKNKVL